MKKSNLPTKLCPVCNRDFTWRKKWIRVWNNVIYCSEKCRRNISIQWSIGFSHKESKEENGMNSEWRRHVRILPERKRYNEKRRVK